MTGQRKHSCVVRLSVTVSKSEIQVHGMQYTFPEDVKGGVDQFLPVHVVQNPRARLPNSGAYIHTVASWTPHRRFLDLGAMTDARDDDELSAACQININGNS